MRTRHFFLSKKSDPQDFRTKNHIPKVHSRYLKTESENRLRPLLEFFSQPRDPSLYPRRNQILYSLNLPESRAFFRKNIPPDQDIFLPQKQKLPPRSKSKNSA